MLMQMLTKVTDIVTITDALTTIFNIDPAEDVTMMRFQIENLDTTAFSDCEFQGSFDGTNWYDIDNAAILSAFGTLSNAKAQIFEDTLYYPLLRFRAKVASGTTTARARILIPRLDTI